MGDAGGAPGPDHRRGRLPLRGRGGNGFVGDRGDIQALLVSMDVSVVRSRSESLSNVILESMAAGVPVVATDVGGNRELLDNERGLLVPPDNSEALAWA